MTSKHVDESNREVDNSDECKEWAKKHSTLLGLFFLIKRHFISSPRGFPIGEMSSLIKDKPSPAVCLFPTTSMESTWTDEKSAQTGKGGVGT